MTRIAFERADDDDLINFAVGQPDRTLIAVDKIQASLSTLKADLTPQSLNYGLPRGEDSFLAPLARFLTHETGVDTQPDHLMLTAGSSQALDMICLAFTEPGDTVLIEDASYFLAFQIFKDRGLQLSICSKGRRRHRPCCASISDRDTSTQTVLHHTFF